MTNTRDRRVLKEASRRSLETAKILWKQGRYNHAMYIGGYAIEAALASWLCLKYKKTNLENLPPIVKDRITGSKIHHLGRLEELFPEIRRRAVLTGSSVSTNPSTTSYYVYWRTIVTTWKYNELRYSDKVGDKAECEKFMTAVEALHTYIHADHL